MNQENAADGVEGRDEGEHERDRGGGDEGDDGPRVEAAAVVVGRRCGLSV